ncbi:response regulator transcription factor [Nocardioides stalactiti]|uniref:response regulator transcription factor n=1 Tax=Nocardioides stalactiti TaxID=2755356 RepID=UPI001601E608|nr:response regulator transcription factor [Nocardioides stalactiti]
MASVVVVEDDPEIRRALVSGLADRGHAVTSFPAGLPVLELVAKDAPDVVVLDLGLPDIGGEQLLSMIRAISAVPVIVVTAQDDDRSIVATLDAGADDYVVKPFGIEQVAARIRAVLRRSAAAPDGGPIRVGELEVDARRRTASVAGRELDLARREFDLLLALASRAGEVVTKRELLAEVWQQPYGGADRTLDVHLSLLRRKLGETAAEPRFLHTVRGVGVRLVEPPGSRVG